jgi:hypothetical protein
MHWSCLIRMPEDCAVAYTWLTGCGLDCKALVEGRFIKNHTIK